MKLAELKAASDRVLLDVNHNIRIGDSIALATFVRDLLALDECRFATVRVSGRCVDVVGVSGNLTPLGAQCLAVDLLRAADYAKDA